MGIKLAKVEIKAYRSLAAHDGIRLDLASGMNALIGPNNVGKSNVVRALALAFGGNVESFSQERDAPAQLLWARPRITLEFRVVGRAGAEKRLLKRAEAVERAAGAKSTYASRGRVLLRVKYTKLEGRQEYLVSKGTGDRRAPDEINRKAIEQLHRSVRFVAVRSGEDLDSFLRGRFSDALGHVLRETRSGDLEVAREWREAYVEGLGDTLLTPLADRVRAELAEVVPEISAVRLVPDVPEIENAVQSARVELTDEAATTLEAKGTGVRGGLLVAMLRYLAEDSRRSLIFAIEEPESFLHPTAQVVIREDLEALAEREDVTLLITTHSPLVLSRAGQARVFGLEKDESGATRIQDVLQGSEPHASVLSPIFRDQLLPALFDEIASVDLPDACRGVLVVEGWTDEIYLRTATAKSGRDDLLYGIHIVAAGGAKQAAFAAVMWAQREIAPVVALLDHDDHGRSARDSLRADFKFGNKRAFTYQRWSDLPGDVEAEALLPDRLFTSFLGDQGEDALASKRRVQRRWIYDIAASHKEQFARHVEERGTRDDLTVFVEILEALAPQFPPGGGA